MGLEHVLPIFVKRIISLTEESKTEFVIVFRLKPMDVLVRHDHGHLTWSGLQIAVSWGSPEQGDKVRFHRHVSSVTDMISQVPSIVGTVAHPGDWPESSAAQAIQNTSFSEICHRNGRKSLAT